MRRLALVIGVLAMGASPAAAASRAEVIRDCADDGRLQGTYTTQELRDARRNLPTDVAEYTDCVDVLRRAELGGEGGGGPTPGGPAGPLGGSGGGGNAPRPAPTPEFVVETPEDQQALDAAEAAPQQTVAVGEEQVSVGQRPLRDGYQANPMPGALVIALVLLALGGAALAVPPMRRAVLARRHA